MLFRSAGSIEESAAATVPTEDSGVFSTLTLPEVLGFGLPAAGLDWDINPFETITAITNNAIRLIEFTPLEK